MVWRNKTLLILLLLLTAAAQGQKRYQDQGDGTVQDTRSELVWLADAGCWGPMSWEEAKASVARLKDGLCGLKDGSKPGDWRLPTQSEWTAMVDCTCAEVVLSDDLGTGCYASGNSTFHGVEPKLYWSSTRSFQGEGQIVAMSLQDSFEYIRSEGAELYVWPVRQAAAAKGSHDDDR